MNHKARFALVQFCFATSLGVGAGSLVLAADTESSARVERFRNALIDQALDAPVRVTSSAWLDESGQLRHVSRFFSEIRTRAASDVLFQAAEASSAPAEPGSREVGGQTRGSPPSQAPGQQAATGPAAATPAVEQSSARASQPPAASAGKSTVTSVVSPGSESAAPCRSGSGDLARLAVLDSLIFPSDGARGHYILQEFERSLKEVLVENSRSGGLKLVALEPVRADTYARLISATGELDAPYRVELRIQSDRIDQAPASQGSHPDQGMIRQGVWAAWRTASELVSAPVSRLPDRRIDVSLSLKAQFGSEVLLQKSFSIAVSGMTPSHNTPVVPDPALADMRSAVAAWWREANEKLRCQMLMVRASPSPVGSVSIPMGAASGVRVGDRWVVGDSAKIPARVLEPGSLERALLAEVVAVGNHKSVLRLSVDQGAARVLFSVEKGASWFATPL